MIPKLKYALALSVAVLAAPQAMACFTVYNTAGLVVYSGMEPPIDMSYQIHERLPAVFPGGHMVFGIYAENCPSIDLRQSVAVSSSGVVLASQGGTRRAPRADRQ